MVVIVTGKNEEIKDKAASPSVQIILHIIFMSKGTFQCTKGQLTQLECSHLYINFSDDILVNDEIWANLKLIQDFMNLQK